MLRRALFLMSLCVSGLAAPAQPLGGDTEWVTIGAVGNTGLDRYEPGWDTYNVGRGAVNYEYRMATTEVTTGQWMEFMNAVNGSREDGTPLSMPHSWGAWHDNGYSGPGARFELRPDRGSDAARLPVAGVGWRDAARYVNWLHNGKQTDSASMGSGAYDTSTFGEEENGWSFTDQRSRSEGARFWIPSLDEWLKAVYYDPSKDNGDGTIGGWWTQPGGSDDPLVQGLAGEPGTQTSAGLDLGSFEYQPVGLYKASGPWGLYDVSGGVSEWTESIVPDDFTPNAKRFIRGSHSEQQDLYGVISDTVWAQEGSDPSGYITVGLRIASVVPAPSTLLCVGTVSIVLGRRRRKECV